MNTLGNILPKAFESPTTIARPLNSLLPGDRIPVESKEKQVKAKSTTHQKDPSPRGGETEQP